MAMYGGGGYEPGPSQFAGGGFMPSPAPGHDTGAGTPSVKKPSGDQTLRAITIKQMYTATQQAGDDHTTVDGEELHNITLLGKIVSLQLQSAFLSFILDDASGRVEVKLWLDNDDGDQPNAKIAEWQVGTYVRIYGHIRTFDNVKSIVAFNVRTVTDFNEITYHALDCIFQHADLTRRASAAAGVATGGMGGAGTFGGAPTAGATGTNAGGFGAGAALGVGGGRMAGAVGNDGLTAVQRDVKTVLDQPENLAKDSGVSLDQIVSLLSNRYSGQQIRDACEFLINEAHAYTTIDDNHFKSTNM